MPTAKIKFEILSYWLAGSGQGESAKINMKPLLSKNGLPILPGKSVKGLFREAVLSYLEFSPEYSKNISSIMEAMFGSRNEKLSPQDRELKRYDTNPGQLRFSNATLGEDMEEWAASSTIKRNSKNEDERTEAAEIEAAKEMLFTTLSSTRLNTKGVAEDHTLRSIQVSIPWTLEAYVESDDKNIKCHEGSEFDWQQILDKSKGFIRSLGSQRHRGLGRVSVSLEEVSA